MAECKDKKLFAEFPPVTTEQWEEVINVDLKGADYEKKLVWKTAEGFNVRPYYRAENLEGIKFLNSAPGQFPYVRGIKNDNAWKINQAVDVNCPKEANADALNILMRGVESITFNLKVEEFTAADLETLLAGIEIPAVEINFRGCVKMLLSVADMFLDKVLKAGYTKDQVSASFAIDPIMQKLSLRGKACNGEMMAKIVELIKKRGELRRVKIITVGGDIFQNCGSTIVQELAFAMAVGSEYLNKLMDNGLSVDDAASAMKFNFSISSNYFMEIAKFRAARMLWANVVAPYQPACECSSKIRIHAITARWNMTVYDAYVNMLRATSEAMSAAIAGVSSIEVLPFDVAYENPTDFSRRIARNIQLILKEESHFDHVVDPAGGAYYIENLTRSIAENAWKLFVEVENKGGYREAFVEGFIQAKVGESAAQKEKNIATRKETLLGTNQFPNFTEIAPAEVTVDTVTKKACGCCCSEEADYKKLVPFRVGMAFEALRLKTDRSGKEPKAFMLTLGNLAMARARAQFASNFMACAGIRPIDNILFHSVEEGVKAALESKAEMVVLCSSDDEYATFAPEVFAQLKDKCVFVIAGAPACKEDLEQIGIKNFISVRSNVLETLTDFQNQLGIK